MREIRRAVNLTKKHLKKSFEIKNAQEVQIHELIAYQRNWGKKQNYSKGEFEPRSPEFPHHLRAYERNERFVNRLSQYVQSLFDFAAKKHAKANFVNGDQYVSPLDLRATALRNLEKEVKFQKPLSSFSISAEEIQKSELKLKKRERKADDTPISSEQIKAEMRYLNFVDPPKPLRMHPDKMNTITRLNLHEFALYPYIERGPLSLQEWQLLLKNIHEMASSYPENLHMMLGTVPVQTQTIINSQKINLLQNIGIYVECGPNPRIHVFGKTVPSTDLIYPKTAISVASLGDTETLKTCESLLNLRNNILQQLKVNPTLSLKDIQSLKVQCEQINLDPPEFKNDLVAYLNKISEEIKEGKLVPQQKRTEKQSPNSSITKHLNDLFSYFFNQYLGQFQPSSALQDLSQRNNVIRLKDRIVEKIRNAPHQLTIEEIDELKTNCDQLNLPMAKLSNLFFLLDSLSSAIKQSRSLEFKIPANAKIKLEEAVTQVLAEITPQFDILYSGNFAVETAGKARIRVNAEICVEHQAGRARQLTKQQIALARKKGTELLPTKGSHIVISNTVVIDPKFQVSASLTHSDPAYPKGYSHVRTKDHEQLSAIDSFQFINPAFGLETRVDSYPPHVVQPLVQEYKEEIELHNEFTLTLMAMQSYRANNPIEINIIDRMINQHILMPFVDHIISEETLSHVNNPYYICLRKLYESSFSYDETIAILDELHTVPEEKQSREFKKQLEITLSLLISERESSNKIRNEIGDIKPQEFKTSSIDDIDKSMLEKLSKIVHPTAVAKEVKLIGWNPKQKNETKKKQTSRFSWFEIEPPSKQLAKPRKLKRAKR